MNTLGLDTASTKTPARVIVVSCETVIDSYRLLFLIIDVFTTICCCCVAMLIV